MVPQTTLTWKCGFQQLDHPLGGMYCITVSLQMVGLLINHRKKEGIPTAF